MPGRIATAALLVLFAAWQGFCFVETWRDTRGLPRLANENFSWPAGWRMFTLLDRSQTRLDFEGFDGGEWVRLPMERWYPMRWDSGFRWERSAKDTGTLKVFLQAACDAAAAAGGPVEAARVVEVRWTRTPGSPVQPEVDRREKVRALHRCGRRVPVARGVEW